MFYLESNAAGYLVVSKDDGKVLEVPKFSDGSEGTELQFSTKTGDDKQRWMIQQDKIGGVSMQGYNGKYAAVKGGSVFNTNAIVLATVQNNATSWKVQPL